MLVPGEDAMSDLIATTLPQSPGAVTACVGAGTLLLVFLLSRKRSPRASGGVPNATEGSFLLGHALAYKKDPAAFLLRQSRTVGSIFRINLAGRRMTVLSGCGGGKGENLSAEVNLLKNAVNTPERILSARDAVSSIGFEHTLGVANVYEGTNFHKRVIKDHLSLGDKFVPLLVSSFQTAFEAEVGCVADACEHVIIADFLGLVRRCTLRAVIQVFLGKAFLEPSQNQDMDGIKFLDDFMTLQDAIEDATAAAAVLPRWLALPLILRPVQKQRIKLQRRIAQRIERAWCAALDDQGPWLREFQRKGLNLTKASEFTVGLLFAAHKNAAIGSAQSFLHLRLHGSKAHQSNARFEAKSLLESPTFSALKQCSHIRMCCMETLRLTSHALGGIRTARQNCILGKNPVLGHKGGQIELFPGEVIAISHIVPSLNKELWGQDADAYNPARKEWTDAKFHPNEYKFTAFSQGLHMCPGQRVALFLMQSCVATLLASYEIEFVGRIPALSFERATLAQRDGNVQVKIRIKCKS